VSLTLVAEPCLRGVAGIEQLQLLQAEMANALAICDYSRVRQLDVACARLIDKLIDTNRDNRALMLSALVDLKGVYVQLLSACEQQRQEAYP